MFVSGLGTANPPHRYTKSECWEAFKTSEGAADIEQAHGERRDGDRVDFNPVAAPRLVENASN